MSGRALLAELFQAGVRAVHAGRAVERSLGEQSPDGERWTVLAAGKAAGTMAEAARAMLGTRVRAGCVVTKDGHALPLADLELREAGHPLPDARSEVAARRALALARGLGPEDGLLVLLSGGASALWAAPAPGLDLEDKRRLTDALLRAGVEIAELNCVRKHLSSIKGGWLAAAAAPARVLTLAVSDVAGDGPDTIGSGPTAPDPTHFAAALEVVRTVAAVPERVRAHLAAGARGERDETPKPGAACFDRSSYRVIASLEDALRAVEEEARARGLRVRSLGRALSGEARELAPVLAAELERARREGIDLIVAGGEPTVTVRGDGRGGRAQELALAFALATAAQPAGAALFAGTDGGDGPTPAAGALIDPETLTRGRAAGLDPREHLERNDSHTFFTATDDLFTTGPTGTNVTDLALIRPRIG